MPEVYGGSGGVSKKAQKIYVGVNNVSKEVQKMYVGVNGAAVLVYPNETASFLNNFKLGSWRNELVIRGL